MDHNTETALDLFNVRFNSSSSSMPLWSDQGRSLMCSIAKWTTNPIHQTNEIQDKKNLITENTYYMNHSIQRAQVDSGNTSSDQRHLLQSATTAAPLWRPEQGKRRRRPCPSKTHREERGNGGEAAAQGERVCEDNTYTPAPPRLRRTLHPQLQREARRGPLPRHPAQVTNGEDRAKTVRVYEMKRNDNGFADIKGSISRTR
jgi:hypothetical protein